MSVFHRLVPLRSNFPLELYIGNNNNYATRQFVWPPRITKERELLRYFRIGETAFMDEEKRKAMEFIRAHPRIFLELTVKRFVAFWTGLTDPVQNFLSTDSWLVRFLLVSNTLAAVGALLGIAALDPQAQPVLATCGSLSRCISLALLHHASKSPLPAPHRSRGPLVGGRRRCSSVGRALWKNRHRRFCGPGDHWQDQLNHFPLGFQRWTDADTTATFLCTRRTYPNKKLSDG